VKPTFFKTPSEWRKWLEKNHHKETELWVGFYKTSSGKPSITWPKSVDEALCFGWIDAIRKSIDEESYVIRFTRRKPKSIWSVVNIKKVEELIKKGLMMEAGLTIFKARDEKKSKIYSFEQEKVELDKNYEKQFKANKEAWKYFQSMPLSYRKPATHWVMSAKQETTRLKRLDTLIRDSEAGRKIKPLSY
jgi:uncharacterized protein YdeI (YjbR/CyaY-like superfamily)